MLCWLYKMKGQDQGQEDSYRYSRLVQVGYHFAVFTRGQLYCIDDALLICVYYGFTF